MCSLELPVVTLYAYENDLNLRLEFFLGVLHRVTDLYLTNNIIDMVGWNSFELFHIPIA